MENIKQAKMTIEQGGVICYPTETVYGLGCDPFERLALEKVFHLKGRELRQTPLLLIPNLDWLPKLTKNVSPIARHLIETFWPGPLTIIFEASSDIPSWLIRDDESIALRWSSHPWVQAFFKEYPKPIVSTSANLSHQTSSGSLEQVKTYFPTGIDYCVEYGELPLSKGSTLVTVLNSEIEIIRSGDISKDEIKKSIQVKS